MKNIHQQFLWGSIILAFVASGSGCVKGNASMNVSPTSYVSLINEAPYGTATDVYFNGTLVSPPGGIAPGQFSAAYGSLKPGNYVVDFKKAGTDSLLHELPAVDYDTATFYTLVLFNVNADSTAVQAARVQDDFSQVTTSFAYYRFFNFSPDIPAVSLLLNGTAAQTNRTTADNILTSAAYNQFETLAPAVYSVEVQNSISDTTLASASGVQLAPGYGYTIFLSGTAKTGYRVSILQAIF
jgi:hypothetical protein